MKKLLTIVFALFFCMLANNVTAAPSLIVSETSIDFGTISVGATDTRTFTVQGSGLSGKVNISSNNSELTVSPNSISRSKANSGAQTVTLTLTPTAAGSGSATVTLTSSGATSKTVTVTWTATADGKWSTAGNWQGGNLPTAEQTARIYKPCTVDITDAVAKAVLVTTGTDGVTTYTGHLTIAPTAGLNVVQKIQKAVDADFAHPEAVTASDLTIQASSAGQGALVSGIGGPGNITPPDDGGELLSSPVGEVPMLWVLVLCVGYVLSVRRIRKNHN